MVLFDVDFVFSCSCFVPNIQCAIERSTKNYEIAAHISSNHVIENFEVDYFNNEKSIFACCFDHLSRISHDNSFYKTKKCYQCYRRSIKSLWKYYLVKKDED